nr:sulfite exporter TauE/SafE family protein [Candidatus Eremiobacteraeota bacterium]
PQTFAKMIPYLLLFATFVFAVAPLLAKPRATPARHTPLQLLAQFLTAIYGGYFGAGIGFLMLAILTFSGLPNFNAMNAIKNVLAAAINGIALVPFIVAGVILWPQAVLMALGAVLGGYLGARIGRKVPARAMRVAVILIGLSMAAYFFVRNGLHG